jgi:hypothetical protein
VVKRLSSSPKSPLPEPKNGCFLAVLIATFQKINRSLAVPDGCLVFGLTETWIVRSAPNGVYMFFVLSLMAFSVNNTQSISDTTLA